MSVAAQKIDVFCPQCRAKLAVPVAAMGKSGRCPHCQNVFPLAMPASRPASYASPQPFAAPASPLSPLTPYSPVPAAASAGMPDLMPLDESDLMPISDAGLSALPSSSHFTPLASNPFADGAPQGDYALQAATTSPYAPAATTLPSNASIASEYLAKAHIAYDEKKNQTYYSNNVNNDDDGWGINAGIGGGAAMMIVAVIWFVAGLFFGWLFFYPPILFIVGLIAFCKGIADNLSS